MLEKEKQNMRQRIHSVMPATAFLFHRHRGQTAIEYVMMISATVVFISLTAFFIKTRVIAP